MKAPLQFLAAVFPRLPSGSSIAPEVDAVFRALLVASGLLVVVLVALNLTFLIRYRRGSPAPRPPLRIATWKIETAWITGTTVAFLAFFVWGTKVYLKLERVPPGAMTIDVVARQWMWDIRQPNGRREFNSLHVPLNEPVRLRLSSEDVIHSFFVPAFRIKQDVVPGKQISAWFEATEPGTYPLYCTQFCGTKHAAMLGEVVVQRPEEYAAWVAAGTPNRDLADQGRALFMRYGCSGCHAASSSVHAPPLEGVYGKLVPLEGGTFVRMDEAYIRDSILEPTKQIVAGYQPLMPSFKGMVSEGDLLELIAYVRKLGDAAPPPSTQEGPR